jgi:predicted AAA+ superfamily ATPase
VGEENVFFWGTHGGAELDILVRRGGKRIGFEVKWADAPKMTRSMHQALADLDLAALFVVYPGRRRYRLQPRVEALPLADLASVF